MAYITVADVRAAGLSSASVDDSAVMAAILLWQQVIDRMCRQFFEPRTCDFMIDGTNSDVLHLPFPVISLSSLYVNNESNALSTEYYRVYNGRGLPVDDRRNPRIQLSSNDRRDIYTASYGSRVFRKGRQNQRLVGIFGFTEADGTTPLPIKRALTKLVIHKLAQPIYVDPNDPDDMEPIALPPTYSSGIITDEWTDWHRIKRESYNQVLPKRADGLSEIIDDPEIRGILKLYRAPLAIATPSNFGWV